MTEKEKVDMYMEKYNDFYTSYPIIVRYMLSLQYNHEAFKKFLKKCRTNIPRKGAKHSEIQDVRFQNQAYYIREMYVQHQKSKHGKGHINYKTADRIFNYSLSQLRKETIVFKKKMENIKKQIEDEDNKSGKEIISELVTKINSGELMNDDIEDDAIDILNSIIDMQNNTQKEMGEVIASGILGSGTIDINKDM
jgi:hypothetical protein